MAEGNMSTDYVVKLRVDTKEADGLTGDVKQLATTASSVGRELSKGLILARGPAEKLIAQFHIMEVSSAKIASNLAKGFTSDLADNFSKGLKLAVDGVIGSLATGIIDAFQKGVERASKVGIRTDKNQSVSQMAANSDLSQQVTQNNSLVQQQQQVQAKASEETNVYVSRIQRFTDALNMVTREKIKDLSETGRVAKETGADVDTARQAIESYNRSSEYKSKNPEKEHVMDLEEVKRLAEIRHQKEEQLIGKSSSNGVVERMEESGKRSINLIERMHNAWQKLNNPTTQYSAKIVAVQNQIDSTYRAMARLTDKKIPTDQWKLLQEQIRQVTKNIDDASGFELSMGNDPNANEGIIRQKQALEDLYAEEQKLIQSGQVFQDMTKTDQYAVLTSQLEQYKARLQELKDEDVGTSRLRLGLDSVSNVLQKLHHHVLNLFGKVFVGSIKKAASAVKSLFSTLKKKASDNAITKSIDNLSKKFTNMWSMLVTRIKRRAIATVFNDIKGVFEQMAQINPEFNESISGMVNSARQLGAQILAIVEPIITRLGPYISKMLDMLTSVADKVAQFMSKAFGYDKYSKAEKGNYDYAKSVDETTDSTKKATKAAKDYENTVMGFDQLNKLNGTNDDSSEEDTAAKLERVNTEANAFNEIAEKIWNAFSNKDYKGAGAAMAEAVNSAFGWLDNTFGWEQNADKLTEKFHNLGDVVNGFIENLHAADIGHAFGNILNTAINGLDILMNDPEHGINFEKLGEDIGQMLISAVQTIHWDKLGSGLAGALTGISTALMTALTTTVENPDTGEEETLGQALGNAVLKFLNGVNDKLDPEEIGGAVGSVIDTITGFFSKAFSDHQAWATFGAKLGQSITNALHSMDREQMKQAIHNFFYSLGRMLGEFVKNVDWKEVFSALWDGIQAGISGISDALDDLLLGGMKTDKSVSDLYKNQKNMDATTRAEIQLAVASGKKYAVSTSLEGLGNDANARELDRRTALENSIANYRAMLEKEIEKGTDTREIEGLTRDIARFEQELAELLEADGVTVDVDPVVVQQANEVSTSTGDIAGGANGDSNRDEKYDQLLEAIQNKDTQLVVKIGSQTITELALKGLLGFNAQYGSGV